MKKTYVFSPQAQTGKTTIAHYLATELGKKSLTCVLELNRYASYLIFLTDSTETKRTLTEALNLDVIENHLVKVKQVEKYMFISKSMTDDLMNLYMINEENLKQVITVLEKQFDHILIDLPANYIEKFLINTLQFYSPNDPMILVLDENIQTFKLLKDYDHYFEQIGFSFREDRLHYVKNKENGFMDEETVQMVLKDLKTLRSRNKVHSLPFVKELILYGNEGKNLLTEGSGTRLEKEFIRGIHTILEELYCE